MYFVFGGGPYILCVYTYLLYEEGYDLLHRACWSIITACYTIVTALRPHLFRVCTAVVDCANASYNKLLLRTTKHHNTKD